MNNTYKIKYFRGEPVLVYEYESISKSITLIQKGSSFANCIMNDNVYITKFFPDINKGEWLAMEIIMIKFIINKISINNMKELFLYGSTVNVINGIKPSNVYKEFILIGIDHIWYPIQCKEMDELAEIMKTQGYLL